MQGTIRYRNSPLIYTRLVGEKPGNKCVECRDIDGDYRGKGRGLPRVYHWQQGIQAPDSYLEPEASLSPQFCTDPEWGVVLG